MCSKVWCNFFRAEVARWACPSHAIGQFLSLQPLQKWWKVYTYKFTIVSSLYHIFFVLSNQIDKRYEKVKNISIFHVKPKFMKEHQSRFKNCFNRVKWSCILPICISVSICLSVPLRGTCAERGKSFEMLPSGSSAHGQSLCQH